MVSGKELILIAVFKSKKDEEFKISYKLDFTASRKAPKVLKCGDYKFAYDASKTKAVDFTKF